MKELFCNINILYIFYGAIKLSLYNNGRLSVFDRRKYIRRFCFTFYSAIKLCVVCMFYLLLKIAAHG